MASAAMMVAPAGAGSDAAAAAAGGFAGSFGTHDTLRALWYFRCSMNAQTPAEHELAEQMRGADLPLASPDQAAESRRFVAATSRMMYTASASSASRCSSSYVDVTSAS